jgi:hypothetical protein
MKNMITLLLFSLSIQAAEIDSVEVGPNTMLITGNGLGNVQRATLARKPIGLLPGRDDYLIVYCKCERWPTGVKRLKLVAPLYKLKIDVTVTGQEVDRQPELPPSEKPKPANNSSFPIE